MKNAVKWTTAAVLVLAACAKEEVPVSLPEETSAETELTSITLTANWTESKVSLGNDLQPIWQDGDQIAIYDGSATRQFTLSENNGSSGTFSGAMSTSANTYYAAYPYASITSFSSTSKTWYTSIPSSQTVPVGEMADPDALVSVCSFTLANTLSFLQATSLVKFTLSESGVKQLVLSSTSDSNIAASRVGIKPADGSYSSISSGNGSSSITLTHASGTFPAGSYYFVCLPATLASGLSVTLTDSNDGITVKSSSSAVTLSRGGGINLGDLSAGSSSDDELVITSDDAGDTTDEDIVDNTAFGRKIYVTFSTSGNATVSGADGQTVSVNGNDVTIDNTTTSEKVIYELSGTTTDGFFKVYSNNKQAFILNGVNITNKAGAAINNQGKKRCFVVVKGSNTLKDGSSYTDTPSDEDEKAAFFSEGQLVFSGSGSLTVTAQGKAGITSDDYVRFMSSPTVTVNTSAGHGVRGKDYVQLSNGTLNITTLANMKKGISSDDYVLVEGGNTTITVTGGVAYDSDDAEYTGSAGIKADNYFAMTGGTVTINNSGSGGKGIKTGNYEYYTTNGSITDSYISGGTLTIKTTGSESNSVSSKGIKIGFKEKVNNSYVYAGNFIVSGGETAVTCTKSESVEAKGNLTFNDGEFYSYSTGDDAINCQGEMNINGGYVYGYATQNDAIDANGNLKINGGHVYAITTKGSPEVALDANTEGGYKLYIYKGATVVAYGGLESNYQSTSTFYSMSASSNSWNAIKNTSGSVIAAFKAPSNLSSFAVTGRDISTSALKGVSVNGSKCNGTWATSASGGSSVTLTTYTQQGGQGGNGHGPGGGH